MQDDELTRLTQVFKAAGAPDPASWARSQLEEGTPQLALLSFCKSLWQIVKTDGDAGWIDRAIAMAAQQPKDPCAQIGPALAEMKAKGVSAEAIIDFARVLQYEALFHACSILDHSREEDVPMHDWGLYLEDAEGRPAQRLDGTHEVLLSLDPSGREMRPKNG
jgi:hypothetical protein